MLKAPSPPAIAPTWGVAMMRDLIAWVRALGKQPAALPSYRAADLPDAAAWFSAAAREGRSALIFVGDESGGAVPAFTDGVNWRRVTDRNVVS
ncbi:MAG: hypothetical protein AB7H70_14305 [Rhodospirillaceae bacterium]